jgi:hypothetical protein
LQIFAAVWAIIEVPEYFLFYQIAALTFSVVIWSAGRLGQVVGFRIRSSTSSIPVTQRGISDAAIDGSVHRDVSGAR